MTFQPGNQLAKNKNKPWRDALNRALKRLPEGNALDAIADRCVADAMSGDKDARKEIAERLDGKVAQPIGGTDDLPAVQTTHIERLIIEHTINPDSEGIPASSTAH